MNHIAGITPVHRINRKRVIHRIKPALQHTLTTRRGLHRQLPLLAGRKRRPQLVIGFQKTVTKPAHRIRVHTRHQHRQSHLARLHIKPAPLRAVHPNMSLRKMLNLRNTQAAQRIIQQHDRRRPRIIRQMKHTLIAKPRIHSPIHSQTGTIRRVRNKHAYPFTHM